MTEALHPSEELPSIYGPDGRPQFFSDPAMDRFVPVVLNLASELWVQTELVADLITLIERKGLATRVELEALSGDGVIDTEREAALAAYIHRVLTPLRENQATSA
jgi:mRNA-degrading endonuclease toxin of MazEF toxin-antitoxin module